MKIYARMIRDFMLKENVFLNGLSRRPDPFDSQH
jgi:hypothetical protein